jgi:aspartyl-tRNA(Asn)/glutamyl-tRNA(Gln) amidotransferase subunit A
VLAACEAAVAALADAGATIEPLEEAFENTEPMWRALTFSAWAARFGGHLVRFGDRMDPTLVDSMQRGRQVGAVELQQALAFRTTLYRRFAGWFARYDALVTPTLARTAVDQRQNVFAAFEIDGVACTSLRAEWYPYTHPFNLTGHPALTLPCGFDGGGLPIGLQIVGPWDSEPLLLQLGGALERRLPWADRRPDIDA